jgi:hypothetical protein
MAYALYILILIDVTRPDPTIHTPTSEKALKILSHPKLVYIFNENFLRPKSVHRIRGHGLEAVVGKSRPST